MAAHARPAQEQIAAFANAVAESGQEVRLVVRDAANEARARELVGGGVTLERHAYGDIWLRDTGPLVVVDEAGQRIARRFGFNGWGGKYIHGRRPAKSAPSWRAMPAGFRSTIADWVLEGGAIDTDGTGLVVTTEQCLLNPNRNPSCRARHRGAAARATSASSGSCGSATGCSSDHTDGHVDNLARFVAPGVLAMPRASEADDPNAAIYADARERALAFGLAVRDVPSPGLDRRGEDASSRRAT